MTLDRAPQGPAPDRNAATPTLSDYFAVVWARRRTVAVTTTAVVLLALLLTILKPVAGASESYNAEAKVLAKPLPTTAEGQHVLPNMATEAELVLSGLILNDVREDLSPQAKDALSSIVATTVPETEIITISASSTDEGAAKAAADAAADAYVSYRVDTAGEILQALEQAALERQSELAERLRSVSHEIREATDAGDKLRLRILQSERSSLVLRQDEVRDRILRLRAANPSDYGAQQIEEASETFTPSSAGDRHVVRNLLLALALGLLIGVGFVLLQGLVDRKIYTEQDVEYRLGLPVVGARLNDRMGERVYSMLSLWLHDGESWSVHLHGRARKTSIIAEGIRSAAASHGRKAPAKPDSGEDGTPGGGQRTDAGSSIEDIKAALQDGRDGRTVTIFETASQIDAQVASSVAGITLHVLEAGRDSEDDARDLVRRLRKAGAKKLAVVLIDPKSERFRI